MKQIIILWFGAALITFLAGFIQSGLSPYYPITGTFGIEGKKVSYKLEKIYRGNEDYNIKILTDIEGLKGTLYWREKNSKSHWKKINMTSAPKILEVSLPLLKPEKESEYYIKVFYKDKEYRIPGNRIVTIKFLGKVPSTIMNLDIFFILLGLLLSTRTGLEYFNDKPKTKKLSLIAFFFFFCSAIVITPFRKTYELNAINHSVPTITQLYEIKPLIILAIWTVAVYLIFKSKRSKLYAIIFASITILTFVLIK